MNEFTNGDNTGGVISLGSVSLKVSWPFDLDPDKQKKIWDEVRKAAKAVEKTLAASS